MSSILEQIEKRAATLAAWQELLRAEAMVYQAHAKHRASLRTGIPYASLRDMPYEEWDTIRTIEDVCGG
jgi:hypothetical protein